MEPLQAIPDGITRDDVLKAIADYDAGTVEHRFKSSTTYDVVHEGNRYPPRALVGIAARRKAGRVLDPNEFPAGVSSRCFETLTDLGFEIVSKIAQPPDAERARARLEAAARAAAMIRTTTTWDQTAVSGLLEHLIADLVNGRPSGRRYGLGLVESAGAKLVKAASELQPWLASVTETDGIDDAVVMRLLQDYWDRKLTNPYLFPTAVFAALDPERYPAFYEPLVKAINGKIDRQFTRKKNASEYLDFSAAVRDLCDAHEWPLCMSDVSLPPTAPRSKPPVSGEEEPPETLADLAALTNLPQDRLQELEEAVLAKGQLVLIGPPGTSKTYLAQQFARYFVQAQPGERVQGRHHVLYMHASWNYEDFFEGLRPKADVEGLQFERRDGVFLKWVEMAQHIPPPARHVLVLDEVNRCDTAAMLGELLQLMEYRGTTVQLLSGRPFVFPRNLYIIGTMNSADRSVGRMDLALRRRFFFFDLMPDPDVLARWLTNRNDCGLDAEVLRECNQYLQTACGIPPEQQIGHALFMPSMPGATGEGSEEDPGLPLTPTLLRQIVSYSVIPYVRELMLERGRDAEVAAKKILSLFSPYWKDDEEEDEDVPADEEPVAVE